MSVEMMALIGLALFVGIMFLSGFSQRADVNKKLEIYERSIEDLHYQVHEINKALHEMTREERFNEDEAKTKITELSKAEIERHLHPMLASLKEIENTIEAFKQEQGTRIDRLENRTKEISNLSSSGTSISNEKMIIAQYSRGRSEAEIAKDLRIGIGEVDLVLKLANLK